MNERSSSNVHVKICISFQSDLADRYYWVRPEGTTVGKLTNFGSSLKMYLSYIFIGELKQQLQQDLNWKRPTEIEVIEIGPLTFKEENKKKGDDSKRKQAIYLLDSEVSHTALIVMIKMLNLCRQFLRKSQNSSAN